MEYKVVLSPKKIVSKEFKVDFKGYNATEVDYFLDTVLADYESFAKMIEVANKEMDDLAKENQALKQEIARLKQENTLAKENVQSLEEQVSPQVDILKRLSALEKAVFNQNFQD